MSSTPFSVSSWKRASGPRTAVQAWPSQCSPRAPVPEFRTEQQSDPTAHASVGELPLTPFRMLSPLNALGLGTTEKAAPAVPGAPSAATAATSAARASSRDDIGPLSSRRRYADDSVYAATAIAVRPLEGFRSRGVMTHESAGESPPPSRASRARPRRVRGLLAFARAAGAGRARGLGLAGTRGCTACS